MPTLISNRPFGVEIEMVDLRASRFIRRMREYNIVIRDEESHSGRPGPDEWMLKPDGSVNGRALELVSPILKTQRGLANLKLIIANLLDCDAKIDPSCGIHVHHDASDMSDGNLKDLFKLFYKFQDMLYMMMDPARCDNQYCRKITSNYYRQMVADNNFGQNIRNMDRYHGINFASLNRHNTVEFRFMEGSLDERKIEAWVILTSRLMGYSKSHRVTDRAVRQTQVQLIGSTLKLLSRNGYTASTDEETIFNLLSGHFHKNRRASTPRRSTGSIDAFVTSGANRPTPEQSQASRHPGGSTTRGFGCDTNNCPLCSQGSMSCSYHWNHG